MEEQEKYLKEYFEFLEKFKTEEVSGAEIGRWVAIMAGYYSQYNLYLLQSSKKLSVVAMENEDKLDETTMKKITSSKAKIMTDATEEAHEYDRRKAHVQNLEQIINALKSLQKGVLNEYSHMSLQ